MIGNVRERLHFLNKGDRVGLNKYRPISVISVVAKVFEGIVYDQFVYLIWKSTGSFANTNQFFVLYTRRSRLFFVLVEILLSN